MGREAHRQGKFLQMSELPATRLVGRAGPSRGKTSSAYCERLGGLHKFRVISQHTHTHLQVRELPLKKVILERRGWERESPDEGSKISDATITDNHRTKASRTPPHERCGGGKKKVNMRCGSRTICQQHDLHS